MKVQIGISVNPPCFDAYKVSGARIAALQMGGRAMVQCDGRDLWELRQGQNGWTWVKLGANDHIFSDGVYMAKRGEFPLVSISIYGEG